jgi:phosphoribosylanthranilate isomerase
VSYTLVKICGICDPGDAQAAVAAGADLVGLHFCPSKRRIDVEGGRQVADAVRGSVKLVGVFIDAPADEVESVRAAVGFDLVQLHGEESPAGYTGPVIKALKVRAGELPDAGSWPDPLLLDSWSENQQGGTGQAWDWRLAAPLVRDRQVIIAGGLRPETVGEVVSALRPFGVDVSSGVESEPRRKDPELMRRFVQAVRDADRSRR